MILKDLIEIISDDCFITVKADGPEERVVAEGSTDRLENVSALLKYENLNVEMITANSRSLEILVENPDVLLADRIISLYKTLDYFEYLNNSITSISEVMDQMENNPKDVIEWLVDKLEDNLE